MVPADFEESEFRAPLYTQLEWGNHLVWEPGQVFEKHMGIDRASYVTNLRFWGLHHRHAPLPGVMLPDYDLKYIWTRRRKRKSLPDFHLNLFLQAKRPSAGTRPRGELRKTGIIGDYWKFSITPHQQAALERLDSTIRDRALVCYAAPAFHTQSALYENTRNLTMVQNTSFPRPASLTAHTAWYYTNGGTFGIANPSFVRIDTQPIEDQIRAFVEGSSSQEPNAASTLATLASGLISSASDISAPSPVETWFHVLLARVERAIDEVASGEDVTAEALEPVRRLLQVNAFCSAYHLDWFVLGPGT
jgi:hypothetical protein